jgi:hypothetical protein
MRIQDKIYIGFDPREVDGFAVTKLSIAEHAILPIPVYGLVLDHFRSMGMYSRPTSIRSYPDGTNEDGTPRLRRVLWDDISGAPMATEFAISRFLIPQMAKAGLSLFMDSDMLVRRDLANLFNMIRKTPGWAEKAVWCVKHEHHAIEGALKMDAQVQTAYSRKNWSSVMVFNNDHPSNKKLTLDLVNSVPGRDLHRFCWLEDKEIGELSPEWNYLVGVNNPIPDPAIVHFTEGIPSMKGYEDQPFADEWRYYLRKWAM